MIVTGRDARRSAPNHIPLSYLELENEARCEAAREDISKRLRKACSYLPDAEFATLVEKIVKVQLGNEGRPR